MGLAWPRIQKDDLLGIYTIVLSYKIIKKLSCFIEYYGFVDSNYSIDGGFAYLLKNNLQFDLYGGFGLVLESPDQLFRAGVSWRIPR